MGRPLRLVVDVDTGIDDAAALLWAATSSDVELVAASATWGNCCVDDAARNTLRVLEAAGSDAPVHVGASGPSGPSPTLMSAALLMGHHGLGDLGRAEPSRAVASHDAAGAIVELARGAPGELTMLCTAPLSTLAAALELEPDLPELLAGLTVMGGVIGGGGNLTAAADANFAHDPAAAARVVERFGRPAALASGAPPRLVPLDATIVATIGESELDALRASTLPGASLLHDVLRAAWPMGLLETGGDGLGLHDLLAAWTLVRPGMCRWEVLPVAVDTAGGAAWGTTVVDRRLRLLEQAGFDVAARAELERLLGVTSARWAVAVAADGDAFRAAVRAWLAGADPGRLQRRHAQTVIRSAPI